MSGISVKLPLSIDDNDGAYKLNKTLIDVVKQNLKHLILTIPGEKIMDPLFGVGLSSYLFENNGNDTYVLIDEKIRQQISKYLSYIEVLGIDFSSDINDITNKNFVHISIRYKILPLSVNDILNIIQEIE